VSGLLAEPSGNVAIQKITQAGENQRDSDEAALADQCEPQDEGN
jgi:hypothetical protein